MTKMVFKVYLWESEVRGGSFVYAGEVSAPSYDKAVEFLKAEGYELNQFELQQIEGVTRA